MKRNDEGFATVEILAAVTIVAYMLLSIAAVYLTAHSSVERSGDATVAVAVGRQALEGMRSIPYDSLVALNGFDTSNPSSLPADDPERAVARKWRYAVAGEGAGWTFSAAEKAKWSSFAQPGSEMQGLIDVDQPSGSLRAITVTLVIPGHPGDLQMATLVSRMDPVNERGFTLLEMLIATVLFMVALLTIGMVFDSNRQSYARGETTIDVQQNARLAVAEMAREIRMTGFFPENFVVPPAAPALDNPIQLANESALAVYGDLEGTGTSSVFLYCLDGTMLRRGRAPQGDAAAYWCPATDILAENVSGLRFVYFDENDDPIPDPPGSSFQLDGQAVGSIPNFSDITQRSSVRRIAISVTVEESIAGRGTQVYDLGSEVLLRNVR